MSFLILYYVFIPNQIGSQFKDLTIDSIKANEFKQMFWTGWLVTSMWTQTIIIHFLRSDKMPFFKTNASTSIYITSIFGIAFVTSAQYIPNLNN